MPDTLTPSFLAVALNAAARSQVSRTALMPCSVKCRVLMKFAIGIFPPRQVGCHQGILSRLPGPGVPWRWAGIGSALVAPAACEVGRHPVKGQGNRTGVRDKTAWPGYSIRPMEVREAVHKALARASQYNEKTDELP